MTGFNWPADRCVEWQTQKHRKPRSQWGRPKVSIPNHFYLLLGDKRNYLLISNDFLSSNDWSRHAYLLLIDCSIKWAFADRTSLWQNGTFAVVSWIRNSEIAVPVVSCRLWRVSNSLNESKVAIQNFIHTVCSPDHCRARRQMTYFHLYIFMVTSKTYMRAIWNHKGQNKQYRCLCFRLRYFPYYFRVHN